MLHPEFIGKTSNFVVGASSCHGPCHGLVEESDRGGLTPAAWCMYLAVVCGDVAALRRVDVLGDHGPTDHELPTLKVHVLPFEAEELRAPENSVKSQEHECVRVSIAAAASISRRIVSSSTHLLYLALRFGHGHWFTTRFPDVRGLGEWIHRDVNQDVLSGLQLVLASLLPAAVALGSLLRIIARRRWVHLVENGRIPGWVLRDTTVQGSAGTPVLTGNGRGQVKVLARVQDAARSYRAADAEPVALGRTPQVVAQEELEGQLKPRMRTR